MILTNIITENNNILQISNYDLFIFFYNYAILLL